MQRLEGKKAEAIRHHFQAAAEVARHATCKRAYCGSVIVKNGEILGSGYNGPPQNQESNRTCGFAWDYEKKPKYDLTCCVHAEWRAVIDACKKCGEDVNGSRLYFMRTDEQGNFTDAGVPYCTVCSRLAMESGVSEFALWNNNGADIYPIGEYDQLSYGYHAVS